MRSHLARTAVVLAGTPLLFLSACGTDSDDPTISAPAAADQAGVRTVPATEALSLVKQPGTVILDVRTPQEYAGGHLESAQNIALGAGFESQVQSLPRDGAYVLYCASGNRSSQAATIMSGLGFTNVADAGGLDGLAAAGGRIIS